MENLLSSAQRFINYNGQIVDAETPIFTASNRAFRYGDGLFETMRFFDGHLLHASRHLARLKLGLGVLHMDGLERLDESFLEHESLKLVEKLNLKTNARIRITVFRNEGGFYAPIDDRFSFLIEAEALHSADAYELNEKGWQIQIFQELILPRNGLSPLKTINALPFVCAGIFKRDKQLDECLLLNAEGRLVEGSSTNLFLVKENRFFTPEIAEGCTQGVMRSVLIDLIREQGALVFEMPVPVESLELADEVFLTNAVQGIRWVAAFNQKRFFNQHARRLTAALNAAVRDRALNVE